MHLHALSKVTSLPGAYAQHAGLSRAHERGSSRVPVGFAQPFSHSHLMFWMSTLDG